MRFLAPAALLSAGLLASVSASADNGPGSADATPPAAAAPATALPPAAPLAPAYPTSLSYGPGDAAPYMLYSAPAAGAPRPYWTPAAAPTVRRSDSMRTAGIVLFAVGGVTTGVGAVMFFPGATAGCSEALPREGDVGPSPIAASLERIRSTHQALINCQTTTIAGIGVLMAGLVTAVVGIPLFVIGSKRVPAATTTGKLVPEVSVGAANASFRWTF